MTIKQKHATQWVESPLVILAVSAPLAVVIGVLPLTWTYSPALACAIALVLLAALAITVKYAPNRK